MISIICCLACAFWKSKIILFYSHTHYYTTILLQSYARTHIQREREGEREKERERGEGTESGYVCLYMQSVHPLLISLNTTLAY